MNKKLKLAILNELEKEIGSSSMANLYSQGYRVGIKKAIEIIKNSFPDQKPDYKLRSKPKTLPVEQVIINTLERLEKENKELKIDILGVQNPWSLRDVLKELIRASNILLHDYDHDGLRHEEIRLCVDRAKEITELLNKRVVL